MKELMFTREQIAEWAERCQKYYISQEAKYYTRREVNTVMMLSKVFVDQKRSQVSQAAKAEFIAYINQDPDKSANSLCRIVKTQEKNPQLIITYSEGFIPNYFFPLDNLTYEDWIKNHVNNDNLKIILLSLLKAESGRIQRKLRREDYNVSVENYSRVWAIFRNYQDEEV